MFDHGDLHASPIPPPHVNNEPLMLCYQVFNFDPTVAYELAFISYTITISFCFYRPSGTEDVVRVYAEAETQVCTINVEHSGTIPIKETIQLLSS